MKVQAKTNVKYDGDWYHAGEIFDVDQTAVPELGDMVAVVGEPATQPAPVKEEKPVEAEKAPEEPKEKPKAAPRRKKASE
jgi:hypothetical protein